jgi:hypothetical protein
MAAHKTADFLKPSDRNMTLDSPSLSPAAQHERRPKSLFTTAEDQTLTQLVESLGDANWHEIAAQMPGRTVRQCRERWNLYLSPDVSMRPWSPDEDALLLRLYAVIGPKWTIIAKQFQARTANTIKNRQKQLQRRLQRLTRFGGRIDAGITTQTADPSAMPMESVQIIVPMGQDFGLSGLPGESDKPAGGN